MQWWCLWAEGKGGPRGEGSPAPSIPVATREERVRHRKGPLLEFKGFAKFYSTARCDLENPTERVGMPSIGKLWQGKKQTVSNWMNAMSGKSLWQLSAQLSISTRAGLLPTPVSARLCPVSYQPEDTLTVSVLANSTALPQRQENSQSLPLCLSFRWLPLHGKFCGGGI